MYYYLKGKIVESNEEFAVIDVHDVGYEFMTINQNDFVVGEDVTVYTLHIVREDAELFVGFKTLREKEIFSQIISVKGVGPKTAVTALRGTTIDKFIAMIDTNDVKSLKKLPGIGSKVASQIILDMKGSLSTSVLTSEETVKKVKLNSEQEAAKNVLKALGFKAKEIDDVLAKLPEILTASEYINECLKRLGK